MPDQQMPPPMGSPPPMQGNSQNQQQAPPKGNAPSFPQPPGQENLGNSESTIEEIEQVVETIIDERWKEVTENIQKVLEWKNTMDERFTKMDEDIKNLKEDFNELYRAIVGKVGEYDKNILKVDTELKALEKVFSQVLPNFTANVNELSRIAQDFKGEQPSASSNSGNSQQDNSHGSDSGYDPNKRRYNADEDSPQKKDKVTEDGQDLLKGDEDKESKN